jgi:hypothetical protein
MMRALLGLLVLGTGCAFEPGELPGGDNSGGGGSGSGSGSGSGDPTVDTDGDGMVDAVDNCATVGNPDQRDHDDDGNGDACDSCPHRVDTGADVDSDGVGDACDPHPTSAGDRVAYFEGFYGALTWDNVIGSNTWVLDLGTLRQPDVEDQHQLVRDDTPNLKAVLIDMRVRINAVSTNPTSRRSMGIVAAHHDEENFLFCGLASQGQDVQVNAGHADTDFWGNGRFTYNETAFAAPMTGDWISVQARTVRLDEYTTRNECSTFRAGLPAPSNAVYDAEISIDGDVGIRTNGADASFDYVFVVEMPMN